MRVGVAPGIGVDIVIALWNFILWAQVMNHRVPKQWPILVDRFHETHQFGIYTRGPHPEERALARVSKDGSLHRRPWPSFETHRLRDAPPDEVREDADMIRTSETLD